ncbi:hypothetical protein P154DRAFT_597263 [Amniculicola lignicola CBS 123094]|uniref:BTB domain-containing protein n=1 Tax=Amniculicola lignicola CBS 123094 TaxID=1392246 RepID=A0A6A5WYX6_9PLEO|nr:hypothetical protein P154DRAFT_597263 [Amniculicola lignicola CBS 123094]
MASATGTYWQIAIDNQTWTLPEDLLLVDSAFFRDRARKISRKDGEGIRLVYFDLSNFDPEIFEMFVEFVKTGKYTSTDDLHDEGRIRNSVRAWVLGDFLKAANFRNCAIKEFHEIYFSDLKAPDKVVPVVTPALIDYIMSRTKPDTMLQRLLYRVCAFYWEDTKVVQVDEEKWFDLFDKHTRFSNKLLKGLNDVVQARANVGGFSQYLEVEESESDEEKK